MRWHQKEVAELSEFRILITLPDRDAISEFRLFATRADNMRARRQPTAPQSCLLITYIWDVFKHLLLFVSFRLIVLEVMWALDFSGPKLNSIQRDLLLSVPHVRGFGMSHLFLQLEHTTQRRLCSTEYTRPRERSDLRHELHFSCSGNTRLRSHSYPSR